MHGDSVHDDSETDSDGGAAAGGAGDTPAGNLVLIRDVKNELETWKKLPVVNIFTGPSGPVWVPAEAKPVVFFDHFFAADGDGPNLWDLFVSEINKYFKYEKARVSVLHKASNMQHWEDITVERMSIYFVGSQYGLTIGTPQTILRTL